MRIILEVDKEQNFIDLWNPEKTRWERYVKVNKEIEIIEEDKKIKKLHTSIDYTGVILSLTDIETRNKINEIIDKINSMEVK